MVDLDFDEASVLGLIAGFQGAGVPVLGLTASEDGGIRARALEAGAAEVHAASVPVAAVTAAVRRPVGG